MTAGRPYGLIRRLPRRELRQLWHAKLEAQIAEAMPRGLTAAEERERPRVRGDCLEGGRNAARPCPWIGCRYHTWPSYTCRGHLTSHHLYGPEDMEVESCALDAADRGPHTLIAVGRILGITRERVRQIEDGAMSKLSRTDRKMLKHHRMSSH